MNRHAILNSRRFRRAAVIATVLFWGVMVAPYPRSLDGAGVPLTLALILLDVVIGAASGWLAFAHDRNLDEWQRTLRDRAYRFAFRLIGLGIVVMVVSVIVGVIAADHNGPQMPNTLNARWVVTLLELIVMLPTVVIAWLQPETEEDTDARSSSWRPWLPALVIPILGTTWLLAIGTLPTRGTVVRDDSHGAVGMPDATCGEFFGSREVGFGFGAALDLQEPVCWDGRRAWIFRRDTMLPHCVIVDGTRDFAKVSGQVCTESVDPAGTLHYVVRARVSSGVGDIAGRTVSLELDVTRDGRVLAAD